MRRILLVAVAALALPVVAVALAPPASAHASLLRSERADGALLDAPPERIRLIFSEPPDPSLTTVQVLRRSGAPVSTGPVRRVAGRVISVAVGDLPDDVYTVTWRTVSSVDGHVTSGAFSFGVGVSAGEVASVDRGRATETPAPTALAVGGRWALYAGLIVLFGAAVAGLAALGPERVAHRRLLAGAWALAASGVIVMTLEERRVVGVPLGTLLRTGTGGAFVRLGVAVAVAGLAVVAAVRRPGRATALVLGAATGGAIAMRAVGGHAAPSVVQGSLQALHLAAAGAWVGGLVWLVAGLRRGVEPQRVRRASGVAAIGLGAIVLTGLLRAADELGPTWWLHLFDTAYGKALSAKVAIVAAIAVLGAVNRFRNVGRYERLGPAPLLRTAGGELVLAAGALAATALLAGLPPAGDRAARASPVTPPIVVSGWDFATTTRVRLRVSPGTVGPNTFEARVTDFDTGEPVRARRVTLRFSLFRRPAVRTSLALERASDGTWRAAGTNLSLAGIWEVDVLVEGASGSVEVPLRVIPRPPGQRVEVSRVAGQPDLYTIRLPGGASIQAYVDPGEPGRTNQVHVTVFDRRGKELPLHHGAIWAAPPDGSPITLAPIPLSPGHFVSDVDIGPGTWAFLITVRTEDGRDLAASFEQSFGGSGP